MPQDQSPTQRPVAIQPQPVKHRVSKKLRDAITNRVKEGLTVVEACRAAGLSESGWHAAMKKPHVRALYDYEMALYIKGIDQLKARHRARAIEIAADMMEHAKSENVRMRAVEFFASETKAGPTVNVAVQNNIAAKSGAYEFAPPGAKVVEVTPPDQADQGSAHDSPSGDQDVQDADIIDD